MSAFTNAVSNRKDKLTYEITEEGVKIRDDKSRDLYDATLEDAIGDIMASVGIKRKG